MSRMSSAYAGLVPALRGASRICDKQRMAIIDIEALQAILTEETKPAGKWSREGLSRESGGKRDLVRDILRGENKNPSADTVVGIMRSLGRDIKEVIKDAPPHQTESGAKEWLEVSGAVAAGVWREQSDWPPDERYKIEVGPCPIRGAERFAVRMEGFSMDKTIPPGADLECLRVAYGTIEPRPGDLVIVERIAHDLTEMTCKRLDLDEDEWILRCESTKPEFQEVIRIGKPDPDAFIDDGVNVIGIVLKHHKNHFQPR